MDCLALQTSHYYLSSSGSLPLGVSKHSLFFLVFHLALVFLSLLAYNKLSIWSFLRYRHSISRLGLCLSGCKWLCTNSNLWGMVGTCVSSAAGGQVGHFNQRSLMQILTQFPIPKRTVPTTFFPVLSCFPCFFLAHFMIGNLDFMQVSRCISVCRENPNSRALLKKERKKESSLSLNSWV